MDSSPASTLIDLQCPVCGTHFDAGLSQTFCKECVSPLLAQYDLDAVRQSLSREQIRNRPRGIWRWAELLPVRSAQHRLELGAGDTPLLAVPRLAKRLGLPGLQIKDEAFNPTGTIKARGLGVAVSKARELGLNHLAVFSPANAGSALAAYAARGGLKAHVCSPADAPLSHQREVLAYHAELYMADNLADETDRPGWFDISAFKEPYQIEGFKTLGFEIAEQMQWHLPDVIIIPTGSGTTLVGLWKAFSEMEALGWIDSHRPQIVSVQAAGCAPVVNAFHQGADKTEPWEKPHTLAAGLRVPSPFAGRLILQTLSQSRGRAIAVTDEDITAAQHEFAVSEGMGNAPEGAATLAGLEHLRESGFIRATDRVLLINTGTGLKYIDSRGEKK